MLSAATCCGKLNIRLEIRSYIQLAYCGNNTCMGTLMDFP